MNDHPSVDVSLLLKTMIWVFGLIAWVFGITDRSIAALGDGYMSAVELLQILVAGLFFLGWISLKPNRNVDNGGVYE